MIIKNNKIIVKKRERYNKTSNKNTDVFLFGYCLGFNKFINNINNNTNLKKILSNINNIKSGKFTIIIKNKTTKEIFVIPDRYGLTPIFYNINKGIVSDSINQIINNTDSKLNLNLNGVSNYINYKYFLESNFFVKEINRCPPGKIIRIKNNQISFYKYYFPDFKFNKKANKKNLIHLNKLFIKGIKEQRKVIKKKEIYCDLSGGYDTRYIFLSNSNLKEILTFDKKSDEYKIVLKICENKNININTIETTEITKDNFIDLFNLGEGYLSSHNPQHTKLVEFVKKNPGVYYDGFLGDAILGGTYLNNKKELLRFLGIKQKYSYNDIINKNKFNYNLLYKKYYNLILKSDDTKKHIKKYDIYDDLRKTTVIFKLYNRGLNFIGTGSNIRNKFTDVIYPFFYYPFFDEYIKYSLDELSLKRLYTKLFKISFNKEKLKVKDDLFKINFLYPQSFRLFYAIIIKTLIKLKIIKENKITDYKPKILSDKKLSDFIIKQVNKLKIIKPITIKDINESYDSVLTLLNFSLFLEKYKNKINDSKKYIKTK